MIARGLAGSSVEESQGNRRPLSRYRPDGERRYPGVRGVNVNQIAYGLFIRVCHRLAGMEINFHSDFHPSANE